MRRGSASPRAAGPVLLAGTAIGLSMHLWAVRATPSVHGPVAELLLAAIYVSLGVWMVAAQAWASRLPGWLGSAHALGWGLLVAWHFREHAGRPLGGPALLDEPVELLAFAGGAVLFAVLLALLGRAVVRRSGPLAAAFPVAALVSWLLLMGVAWLGPVSVRWHLLQHHKLLGPVAMHAFGGFLDQDPRTRWSGRHPQEAEVAPPPEPRPAPAARPDVVFIVVDALRADALQDPAAAPLRRFAAEGWSFTDVQANASWTLPAMSSALTGLAPEEHGAVRGGDRLPERRTTLAEIFRSWGYRTDAIVASGAVMGPAHGLAQGFDNFDDFGRINAYGRAEPLADRAVEWLTSRTDGDPPFFLYLHFLDPHLPYRSGGEENPASIEASREGYAREVAYLARALDAVDFFRAAGPSRPRLVLLMADHGEELGEHGERGHGYSLYHEVLDIPLLLHAPGGGAGPIDAPLEERDIFDLVLSTVAGADVRGWAADHARPVRRASLYAGDRSPLYHWLRPYHAPGFMWRTSRAGEAVIRTGRGDLLEYYDLAADPGELRNLVATRGPEARRLADAYLEGVRYWADLEAGQLDEEDIERLRSLGYVQ